MTTRSHRFAALVFAVISTATAVSAGLANWPQPNQTLEFSGLMLVALLAAAFDPRPIAAMRATMAPAFVIECSALLLLGPPALVVVATCGAVMHVIADPRRHRLGRVILLVLAAAGSALAAGAIHRVSGGTTGTFMWPEQA